MLLDVLIIRLRVKAFRCFMHASPFPHIPPSLLLFVARNSRYSLKILHYSHPGARASSTHIHFLSFSVEICRDPPDFLVGLFLL